MVGKGEKCGKTAPPAGKVREMDRRVDFGVVFWYNKSKYVQQVQ